MWPFSGKKAGQYRSDIPLEVHQLAETAYLVPRADNGMIIHRPGRVGYYQGLKTAETIISNEFPYMTPTAQHSAAKWLNEHLTSTCRSLARSGPFGELMAGRQAQRSSDYVNRWRDE